MGYSTPRAKDLGHPLSAVGLRGNWSPAEGGWIPSISAGIDFGFADGQFDGNAEAVKGWMVGLNWKDAFMDGNKLGVGFGSYSSYATSVKGQGWPDDENFAVEVYYDFRVTDNIQVTPAIFWVDDAYGQEHSLVRTNLVDLSKPPSSSDHSMAHSNQQTQWSITDAHFFFDDDWSATKKPPREAA